MWGAIKAAGLAAGSSLLHVGWNAAAKNAVARLKEMAVLAISGGIVAALIAGPQLFSSAVREMSGWIVLTIVLNAAYFGLLAWTYRQTNLGTAYPLMRSLAIVWASFWGSGSWLWPEWTSLALILGSVGWLQFWHKLPGRLVTGALVGNSLLIAGYSLVDRHLVQHISPWAVNAYIMLGSGIILAGAALWKKGQRLSWRTRGIFAASGTVEMISYVLILYAYRLAPVALVLAVRQIGPAFSPWVGRWASHEEIDYRQLAAVMLMVLASLGLAGTGTA